jgi:hypothetical protein
MAWLGRSASMVTVTGIGRLTGAAEKHHPPTPVVPGVSAVTRKLSFQINVQIIKHSSVNLEKFFNISLFNG